MILDAERIAGAMLDPPDDLRALLLAFYPNGAIPPVDHVDTTATPLVARVNLGVWIASCDCGATGVPSPGCVVWLSRPLGWCIRCGNRAANGRWRPILLPAAERRAEIEAVLRLRAQIGDRNWEPCESLDELIRQNVEHGDPIPEES